MSAPASFDYVEAAYVMTFGPDEGNTVIGVRDVLASGIDTDYALDAYRAWFDLAYQAKKEDLAQDDRVIGLGD